MTYIQLAEMIFPNVTKTAADWLAAYPPRPLPPGTPVVRIPPSPTGYLHIGVLFAATVNRLTADKNAGVFYMRLEDTDQKREMEGGAEDIVNGFIYYGVAPDEGYFSFDDQRGAYGPYRQRDRAEIYHAFAKWMVQRNLAYPCFCSAETLEKVREKQRENKQTPGYHGEFAICRALTPEQVEENILAGKPYVIRLRSPGNPADSFVYNDLIKGELTLPVNDRDEVLLKSDGIPTYHFAHAIDDTLMRTTIVIRGEEWLSSVPLHHQLFALLGFKKPDYAHFSSLMKEDGGGRRRKLSKRKDPEVAVHFYKQQGFPVDSVAEYLMTIINSDFEEWRRQNPAEKRSEFPFALSKMSISGALFDLVKFNDVSKQVISGYTARQVLDYLLEWTFEFDADFHALLKRDESYAASVLSIDRGGDKPRKDIACWNQAKDYMAYFYEELFTGAGSLPAHITAADAAAVAEAYADVYNPKTDKETWFSAMKALCAECGFCAEMKAYKQNPAGYKGSIADFSAIIRLAVTGRANAPDLHAVLRLLGAQRVQNRLQSAAKNWQTS